MTYPNIFPARFLRRPNRFIAEIQLESGQVQICHVKNTGRCRELLLPGARILVQKAANPSRKTDWDLIAVWKGARLINMDAAAPNQVFFEHLQAGGLGFVPDCIRPEQRFGDSRFDFYFEAGTRRAFAEVKGVTLERDGAVFFPDAPTLRGVKHLLGLIDCVHAGFDAWAVVIVQMQGAAYFSPNWETHPEFGQALRSAQDAGVQLLALDCTVTETSLCARSPVPIRL